MTCISSGACIMLSGSFSKKVRGKFRVSNGKEEIKIARNCNDLFSSSVVGKQYQQLRTRTFW